MQKSPFAINANMNVWLLNASRVKTSHQQKDHTEVGTSVKHESHRKDGCSGESWRWIGSLARYHNTVPLLKMEKNRNSTSALNRTEHMKANNFPQKDARKPQQIAKYKSVDKHPKIPQMTPKHKHLHREFNNW